MIYATPKYDIVEGYINETSIILEEEKKSLDFVDNVPEDFRDCIIKIMTGIEKETGKKVGSGAADAAFGNIKISLGNAKDRIKKGKLKNNYSIIIPGKVFKNIPDKSLSGDDFIAKVVKSNGFAKGGNMMDPWQGYYYKKGKNAIYALGWYHAINQTQIQVICVNDSKENLAFIKKNHNIISESVSSEDSENNNNFTTNNTGLKRMSIEDYTGSSADSLGVARSEELSKDPVYGDFFRNPIALNAFTEHLDLSDTLTRKAILVMNEAEQSSVLASLTSKLYDNIVSKVDDIDYGDIPATKGDITKLSNYEKLRECIELLRGILNEFKQDTTPIDTVSEALANIMSRKDLFGRAFKLDVELPIIMYNNTVLSIINAVSYMIATSIEFMKTPNQDSFQITLDKVAYSKTKSNMLYNNLKKFNRCCKNNDFDKAMEFIIKKRVENASVREGAVIGTGAVIAGIAVLLNIIPILREMVFFFYYTRMRVSEFFDIQADLLQMNAYNVENNDKIDNEKKQRVVSKQLKIVELFRKIANKITISGRKAELDTTKEIEKSERKMKINDVSKELPDSVSALF